jgi:hypothetical protein
VDDGSSIEEWVKVWKESDEGKALRLAPVNTGGGSKGGKRGVNTKPWSDMSLDERAKLFKENPEAYRKLKETAGAAS